MIVHSKVRNGLEEGRNVDIEEFLKTPDLDLADREILYVKATREELKQLKEASLKITEQYAQAQQEYGITPKKQPEQIKTKTTIEQLEEFLAVSKNLNNFNEYKEYEAEMRELQKSDAEKTASDAELAETARRVLSGETLDSALKNVALAKSNPAESIQEAVLAEQSPSKPISTGNTSNAS